MSLESDEIRLWCWVLGDTPNEIFEVFIKRSATINRLKMAIQGLKQPFKDINAEALTPYNFLRWANGIDKRRRTDINSW